MRLISKLFLVILFLSPAPALADRMYDLTSHDAWLRAGFDSQWLNQTPNADQWLQIPASSVGSRSIIIRDWVKELKLQDTEQNQSFTLSIPLNISSDVTSHQGVYLATVGDNWSVYFNGHLIGQKMDLDSNGSILKHNYSKHVLLEIQKQHFLDGENLLTIHVYGEVDDTSVGLYLSQPYLLGSYADLVPLKNDLSRLVLIFSYLLIGTFFIIIYLRRSHTKQSLFFGLSCLLISAYLFSRHSLMYSLNLDSLLISKLEYACVFMTGSILMAFYDSVFDKPVSKLSWGYITFCLILALSLIPLDAIDSVTILYTWQLSTILPIGHILFVNQANSLISEFKISLEKHNRGIKRLLSPMLNTTAGQLSISTLILVSCVVLDIIDAVYGVSGIDRTQYGFFVFVVGNAYVLASKFIRAQEAAERLSTQLESEVNKQTQELRESNQALKEARDKANAASKAKGDFLANMSHEIRTPMNGILGTLTLLGESSLNQEQTKYLNLAQSSANLLLSILNDILDVSKIEAGKLVIEQVPFNPIETIENTMAIIDISIQSKQLTSELIIDKSIPKMIVGDPVRLKQVLLNLLNNAVKFTDTGSICLKVEEETSENEEIILTFHVIDTGIGIPESIVDNLFTKFTQADTSITRKYGGTGLGLAICQELVKAMGGDIGVNSIENQGSDFWFNCRYLKVSEHEQRDDEKEEKVLEHGLFPNARLMVVEDNPTNQIVIKTILKKLGLEPILAENGHDALQSLAEQEVDLILMDMQMPVMDGLEASRQIRQGNAGSVNQHKPIIAITANAMQEDRDKCLNAGMSDYMSKPIKQEILIEKLHHWLTVN